MRKLHNVIVTGNLSLENIVPLTLMAAGEFGQVIQVDGSGDVVHRLAEMGLREQAFVRMVQPGCPCIIALNDQRLSLRTDDDVEILVSLSQL
ncbi:MAG: FeoA family protein [Planctomycetia bacterium]|nr:FeoA family protein [Planctomycetia bacterium]